VPGSGLNRDDDLWLAYGDYEIPRLASDEREKERNKNAKKKEKELKKKHAAQHSLGSVRDWEEATRLENKGRTGEWRRRRWVRLVKRTVLGGTGTSAGAVAISAAAAGSSAST